LLLFRTRLIVSALIASTSLVGQGFDEELFEQLHTNRQTGLDTPLKWASETASPVSMLAPSIVFGSGFLQMNRSTKHKGLFLAECMAVNTVFTLGLKYTLDRDRPSEANNQIEPLTDASSPSLPSGHTSNAFTTATALTLAFPKWYVAAPAYAWASAVGYSRIHLGVHYPTDVLAGALLGAGSAFVTAWANKKLFHAPAKPRNY